MEKIRILLVDDHQIILDGLKLMLEGESGIEICHTAANGKQALELVKKHHHDIILTDVSMPDMSGLELAEQIQASGLSTRILMLSVHSGDEYIIRALKAGVKGFLTKQDTTRDELLKAIDNISRGEEYFSPSVEKRIMKIYLDQTRKNTTTETAQEQSLTTRETEILKLYAEGYSNQEIADKLFISTRTVDAHKNNIMHKFKFKSTVEMLKYAIRNKLVKLD